MKSVMGKELSPARHAMARRPNPVKSAMGRGLSHVQSATMMGKLLVVPAMDRKYVQFVTEEKLKRLEL